MESIRLVVADDHPVVRDGLRAMLETQPDIDVVGEATTGAEAVAIVRSLRPDLVLMDLQMPDLDGTTATRHIRAEYEDVQVLILTTYDTDADISRAVEAGATGYLLRMRAATNCSRRCEWPLAASRSCPPESRLASWARCARPRSRRSAHERSTFWNPSHEDSQIEPLLVHYTSAKPRLKLTCYMSSRSSALMTEQRRCPRGWDGESPVRVG